MTAEPKPTVYIETTIPSYLTAWSSRDLIRAAEQQLTKEWWEVRDRYELRISTYVVRECEAGDPEAADARMKSLDDIPIFAPSDQGDLLAEQLMLGVPLPPVASVDASHIASAAVGRCRYLLTWNCTHIANATLRSKIEAICRQMGYEPPIICTPKELLGAT